MKFNSKIISAVILLTVLLGCFKNTVEKTEVKEAAKETPEATSTEIESVPLTPAEADAFIKRGEYLTSVSACGVCHSKAGKIKTPLSGGRILYDNYGKIVSPNITPDKETGIGLWKVGEIKSVLRESVGKDGKKISIAAHQNFRWLSDEDTLAIALYLQSLEPVKNDVALVAEVDKSLKRWSFLNSHMKFQGYVPTLPEKSGGYRGLYLVAFVQNCSRCHSPKEKMADKSDYLGGHLGTIEFLDTTDKVEIPSIRNDEKGLKSKSEEQIISHLSRKSKTKSESCPTNFYSNLNDIDKKAVAVYLKSLK